MQNIPSHRKDIRLLFCAGIDDGIVESDDNVLHLYKTDDVFTPYGWVCASDLTAGNIILSDDGTSVIVTEILVDGNFINIYFNSDIGTEVML